MVSRVSAFRDPTARLGEPSRRTLTPEQVQRFRSTLAGENDGEVELAVEALAEYDDEQALSLLISVLRKYFGLAYSEQAGRILSQAEQAVLGYGRQAIEPLKAAALNGDADVFLVANLLRRIDPACAVDALVAVVRMGVSRGSWQDDSKCMLAAEYLGDFGDPRASESLGEMLASDNPAMIHSAAVALYKLGRRDMADLLLDLFRRMGSMRPVQTAEPEFDTDSGTVSWRTVEDADRQVFTFRVFPGHTPQTLARLWGDVARTLGDIGDAKTVSSVRETLEQARDHPPPEEQATQWEPIRREAEQALREINARSGHGAGV